MEVPESFWQWAAGGIASTVTAGCAAVWGIFKSDVAAVRTEVRDLDAKMGRQFDDVWEVINAEREAASRARERNFNRLEQTPTRGEMQNGFDRLEKLIRLGRED